jgi:RimJ/RimL family protein N-acetyltransferase
MSRGEKRWAAQFSEEDVRVIRVMARNGASRTEIAKLFGCVKGRIRDVVLYRTWRHVE